MHHRNHRGRRLQRAAHVAGIDYARSADGHIRHLAAFARDLRAGAEDGWMLDGSRNHMLARAGPQYAQQRQVIRLRPAAYEHDLARMAVQQRGRLPPRHLQALFGQLAEMVDTGRVAIYFAPARPHRLENLRRYRCGRIMVEVVTLHFSLL